MTMIKTLGAVTVATFVLGSAAFAGTLEEPIVETAPAPTVAPVVASSDWTGLYGGLNLGYGDYDADGGLDGDDVTYGVHFGYDYDLAITCWVQKSNTTSPTSAWAAAKRSTT